MSGFQRARTALGIRLRELRHEARLTGPQLAASQGWHPSKISKIEGGRQTPSEEDIEGWVRACGHPELSAELTATLRTLDEQYVEFRRMFWAGQRANQQALSQIETETTFVRNFENACVPGLLQTAEYARCMLSERLTDVAGLDDVDDAVTARMQRQQELYCPGKRFHFVITEAVLRYRLCPVHVMIGQLDRLVSLSTLTTTRFGIVPFGAQLPLIPAHGFHLYDERIVHVEHFTAVLKLTQPSEVAAYAKVFTQLAHAAVYGSAARAVITNILADLATALE